jgi:outer membrane protein assembly factor BamA
MRWGEPLSVYDNELIGRTNDQIGLYMKTKGYFRSNSTLAVRYEGRRAHVTYKIHEGTAHVIDTLNYITSDSGVYKIIMDNIEESLLKSGDHYDQSNLTAERERIDRLLKNHGYFDFNRQYISYEVDTLSKPFKADIDLIIKNPARRGFHKVFKVDSVVFVTDAGAKGFDGPRQTSHYNGITYQYFNKRFSKRVLDQRVFIYNDSLYSLEDTRNTQRMLAFLDNFKFININYDTTGGRFIANIFTSPLKKYQATNEVGLNVTQGFPGPFYNLSLKNRNIFGGLENLELSGFFGFEGVASATTTDIYSSIEAGGKLALIFPQFLIPAVSKMRTSVNKFKKRSGILNPNTTLRAGFNYTNRPEYTRSNFNTAWTYNWQKERRKFYNFTLAEVSLINTKNVTNEFQDILDELDSLGNPLSRSFLPSFVNSMNFYVMYNFNPDDFLGNRSSLLKIFAEAGGTIWNVVDPSFFGDPVNGDGLEHYQFLKLSTDFRRHLTTGEHSGFATRLNIGVAYPYGSNKTLPYEKFFFAGGSNSIRAWPPRRLGPGSQKPRENENIEQDGQFDYSIEKPGEVLIEASIEYRSKLIGFIDWALFVDMGNVWTLRENNDPRFTGGDFKFNRFYKEIAIGMGAGIRLNFSFLVIRFDYGIKMVDPAQDEGLRWIGDNISLTNLRGDPGQALWNIAIGYPF